MKTARTLRRVSQWAVFLLFVFLFLNTEYKDNDVLPYAVNLFLRLDPLMAGAAALAGRAFIGLVWPALVVALPPVALGRGFCARVCPPGAGIRMPARASRPIRSMGSPRMVFGLPRRKWRRAGSVAWTET